MVTEPGIYQMTAAEYHADPCPTPSLSASCIKTLLGKSPLHAKHAHPRLNPAYVREESEQFDLGTAAHAYLLEGETGFVVVDAPDWRTKAAQTARDAARVAGKTPILAHRWADVQLMAHAASLQIADRGVFGPGRPEQTLIWREGDVWCRARPDWLAHDYRTMDDYKTTGASANPEDWTRTLFAAGHDVQAAFYRRGLKALTNVDATFRFVVQENYAPYALSVIALAPDALALAERKVGQAISLWGACLSSGVWPGYTPQTCYAELPPWMEAQQMEREMRAEGRVEDL